MPTLRKELHFFDRAPVAVPYAAYPSMLLSRAAAQGDGRDITGIYVLSGGDETGVALQPKLKIIALLRDPIDRALSQWNMRRIRGRAKEFNAEALLSGSDSKKQSDPLLRRELYTHQLDNIFALFPKEQVLLLQNEDLKTKHEETLQRVADFLGIGPFPAMTMREVHALPYTERLSRDDYRRLRAFYDEDVRSLQAKYGIDTSKWMTRYD